MEALETEKERKKLHVEIVEIEKFFIEVRNESPYISYDMLGNFFNKGFEYYLLTLEMALSIIRAFSVLFLFLLL